MTEKERTIGDFSTPETPSWCPGCGNFGIISSLKQALLQSGSDPDNTVVVSGIGCGSLMPYWFKTYGVCTLHGRAIPFGTGVKIANHDLRVIVNCGDGDGLGIGAGHFVHFFRRNLDITVIIDNNGVYGLTKGQTSPTAKKGTVTSSTPFGSLEEFTNGEALAITMGATFVARGYTADQKGLTEILKKAIEHKGSSFVNILQPCVIFNKVETYDFYKERVLTLEKPFASRNEAYAFVTTPQEKIPVGIIFEENLPTYEERLPQMAKAPLVRHDLRNIDVSAFMDERT